MESEFLSTIIRHKRYAKHIPEITRQLYQKFTIFSPMHKKPLKRQYSFTQNPVEAPQPKITKSIPKILNSADKRNEQLKKRGVLLFTVQDRAKKEERKKSTQSLNLNPNPVVSRAEPIATCKFYGGSPKKTLNVSKQVDKFIDLKKLDYIYDDDINEDEMFAEEDENFISPTKFKSPGLPNICSINKGTPKANTELNMNVFYSPSFNSPIRTLRFS